jgi:hypothetical protein
MKGFLLPALVVGAALGCNGSDKPTVPCPMPPGETVPAAETVSVGGVAAFAIPAQPIPRRLQWSSDRTTVATIPRDTGRATGRAVGTAIIMALDIDSPENCRVQWEGQLVVR